MRCFYFAKTSKQVGLWCRHYGSAREADDAFYDGIRLFYPVPAILYDCGYPTYSYEAYLKKTREEEQESPGTPPEYRRQFDF